jgi:hypothetical protein
MLLAGERNTVRHGRRAHAIQGLDFSENMNQHAVLCQVLRLALSVIYILQNF